MVLTGLTSLVASALVLLQPGAVTPASGKDAPGSGTSAPTAGTRAPPAAPAAPSGQSPRTLAQAPGASGPDIGGAADDPVLKKGLDPETSQPEEPDEPLHPRWYAFHGELRLRDHVDTGGGEALRHRIRMRLRVRGELRYKGFFVGAGVRSANDGIAGLTSDNATLYDNQADVGFPRFLVHLGYIGYIYRRPDAVYRVAAGYIYNPFQTNPLLYDEEVVLKREIQSIRVFDRDNQPLGLAVQGAWRTGANTRAFATGGLWVLGPQGGRASDLMAGGQLGAVFPNVLLAASYYHFGRPGGDLAVFAAEEGNTPVIDPKTGEPTGVAAEFRLLSVTSRVHLGGLLPWRALKHTSLQIEYTRNLATSARANAVYVQLSGNLFHKLKWLIDGFYVQADSVFASYADSDRRFTDVGGASTAASWVFNKYFFVTGNYFVTWPLSQPIPMEHRIFFSMSAVLDI